MTSYTLLPSSFSLLFLSSSSGACTVRSDRRDREEGGGRRARVRGRKGEEGREGGEGRGLVAESDAEGRGTRMNVDDSEVCVCVSDLE